MTKKFSQFRAKNAQSFIERRKANMSEAERDAQAEGAAKRQSLKKAEQAAKSADVGAQDLTGLKKMLNRKYGNLMRAWKQAFDTKDNGKISFVEFCNACRRLASQVLSNLFG